MESVGVRELRQRASSLLRRVESGETLEITDHGRPVALLGPLPDKGPMNQLRAAGDVTPRRRDMTDLPAPLALPTGQEAPSRVLERLRRNER